MMKKSAGKENRIQRRAGIKPRLFFLSLLIFTVALNGAFALAQDSTNDEAVLSEVERLKALKAENPQAYQEHIQKKKDQLKNRVQKLQQDKTRYQAFMEKENRFKKDRLERIQNKRPEAYRTFMAGRAERLEKLSQQNPERFNQVMNSHPRAKERHEKRKMNRDVGEMRMMQNPERSKLPEENQRLPNRARMQESGKLQQRPQENGRQSFVGQKQGEFQERKFQNREGFKAGQNSSQTAAFNPGTRQFQDGRQPMMSQGAQNQNGGGQKPGFQEMSNGAKSLVHGGSGKNRDRGGRKSPK